MEGHILLPYFLNLLILATCTYPPVGEEVLPGSVLLPATRRGRYLANIVRRQAVDGTGIKFNKDADRMNAEAKKKVDVLSEELLPYIIAEQERRTTLYKRIMTAIQTGDKGITIAEMRNKPPLLIRRGQLYRCPSNRAPVEPDGSGVMMCEENNTPTPIIYDSCLGAEDKDLYVADSKYFFCNRHRIEGPDIPRNGSKPIGCTPIERTSLNYTVTKCALEDTDDVVVHYRYYPDRSYKYVTELDPDHEVCDHWDPCQIGYIFSLPTQDQAIAANELWNPQQTEVSDYEHDEIVPQDAVAEYVPISASYYNTSLRAVAVPPGHTLVGVVARRSSDERNWDPSLNKLGTHVNQHQSGNFIFIQISFPKLWSHWFYGSYYLVFQRGARKTALIHKKFLVIDQSSFNVSYISLQGVFGDIFNNTSIPFSCPKCHIEGIIVRSPPPPEGLVTSFDPARYKVREHGDRRSYLDLTLNTTRPEEFGDYYALIKNQDGLQERVKILTLTVVQLSKVMQVSIKPGDSFEDTATYTCDSCEFVRVLFNGRSTNDLVSVVPSSKTVRISIDDYSDDMAGIYVVVFQANGQLYRVTVAEIEITVEKHSQRVSLSGREKYFERAIPYNCGDIDCTTDKVTLDGAVHIEREVRTRRSDSNPGVSATYFVNQTTKEITLKIPQLSGIWSGTYQATFDVMSDKVTISIMHLDIGKWRAPQTSLPYNPVGPDTGSC